ncbi:hypothetical protein [Hydrotalea sp.]|nr:hypothetical protein [Hydrotalea sp.]
MGSLALIEAHTHPNRYAARIYNRKHWVHCVCRVAGHPKTGIMLI